MNKLKKLSGMAVSVLLVLSLLTNFVIVSADVETTPERNIILGTDHIKGGQVSNIYFGKYPQTSLGETQPEAGTEGVDWIKDETAVKNSMGPYYSMDPIKWRVLYNSGEKILILSNMILDNRCYHEGSSVTWEESTIRSWLNGYDADANIGGDSGISYVSNNFLDSSFSVAEKDLIVNTNVKNKDYTSYWGISGGNDTTDKIFLLSINEAKNTEYGFENNTDPSSTRQAYRTQYVTGGGHNNAWWLRSPGNKYYFEAAFITDYNEMDIVGVHVRLYDFGIRPALNLDISSVLFTSGEGAYALTFKDSSREFAVSDKTAKTVLQGESLSFDYTGAKVLGGEYGNEYVSAVLVDSENAVKHYVQLEKPVSEDGTATYTFPADMPAGEYSLMLFNEQYNGEKKISFASDLKTNSIPLTVMPKEFKIVSLGEDSKSAMVEIPLAGTYSLIFADYEDCRLKTLDVITKDFAVGKTTVSSEKEISLGTGDKIMLWCNMEDIESLCETMVIE